MVRVVEYGGGEQGVVMGRQEIEYVIWPSRVRYGKDRELGEEETERGLVNGGRRGCLHGVRVVV